MRHSCRPENTRWMFSAWILLLSACLGDVEVPPAPPSLFPLESPTRRPRVLLEGTKPAGTAVLNHGDLIVSHDGEQIWSHSLDLAPGENLIDLTSQWPSGKGSREHTWATIVLEPDFPAPPVLDPVVSPTRLSSQRISGSKPAETSLELVRWLGPDGTPAASLPLGTETGWSFDLALDGGEGALHRYSLQAVDARGRGSDLVFFEILLDQTPPAVAGRYPQDAESDVPSNALVVLSLTEPVDLALDSIPEGLLIVTDDGGTAVSVSPYYNPVSHSLTLAAAFSPDRAYTVAANPTLLVDLAGNVAAAGAGWTWSFSIGSGEEHTTPNPPQVDPGPGGSASSFETDQASLVLAGDRDPLTSVWANGSELVPLQASPRWSAPIPLAVGDNALSLTCKSRTGDESASVSISIHRELIRPDPPSLDPPPPEVVAEPFVVIGGGKPAGTKVLLDGRAVVPLGADTSWVYRADLVPGVNEMELRSRDMAGVLSEPMRFQVDFAQPYQGPVEAGYKLMISFALRDLSQVDPVRTSFETGANRYSIDAWIEGPLDPGESCQFDGLAKERRNIKYVATMVHYIGSKASQSNPFWDADYRAPDYLAALISAGVFETVGLPANTDRRDDNTGLQGGDLVDGTGRVRISSADLQAIDGVTEATVSAGPYSLEWVPLDRNFQRIQQGEYLVHILIGLDRDPGWVASNDLETCWSDGAFSDTSQHRIVRRLSLGATPFAVTVGQTAELSAPDAEHGADQLRYLTSGGVTFRWIKAN